MIDEDDRGSGRIPAGPTEHETTSSGGAAAEGPALRPEEEPTTTGTLFNHDPRALGYGVDPDEAHVALAEGTEFMEKAKIELYCRAVELEEVIRLVREQASTGHRGDGVIAVTPLERLVSVRTGDEEFLAVL